MAVGGGAEVSFLAVLPSVYPLWTDRCVNSMSPEFQAGLLTVDNTVTNVGVGAAWNQGLDRVVAEQRDWLVLLSAATRFGPAGGDDFLVELAIGRPDVVAIEAGHGVGWHLIAFPRWVVEAVGRFDEIFFAYMEDIDYSRRISLTLGLDPPYWNKTADLDVSIAGFSHGVDLAKVHVDNYELAWLYERKWGGAKGAETFDVPYGSLPLTHTGPP